MAALIGLGAGWAALHDLARRVTDLERHGTIKRASVAVTEDMTDTLLQAAEDVHAASARIDNLLTKAEFVRHTGKLNAPWSEIINWKNGQKK